MVQCWWWHGQGKLVRGVKEHGQATLDRGTEGLSFVVRGGTDKLALSVGRKSTDNLRLTVAPTWSRWVARTNLVCP